MIMHFYIFKARPVKFSVFLQTCPIWFSEIQKKKKLGENFFNNTYFWSPVLLAGLQYQKFKTNTL